MTYVSSYAVLQWRSSTLEGNMQGKLSVIPKVYVLMPGNGPVLADCCDCVSVSVMPLGC